MRHRRRLIIVFALAALGLTQSAGADAIGACPNETIRAEQGSTDLPDCRAYELVSPADKNGQDVFVDNSLFRISQAESAGLPAAAMFPSLAGFADAHGSGVMFEYVAQRTPVPGTQGWSTHAVTPLQEPTPYAALTQNESPAYLGDSDPSLTRLVFRAWTPLGPTPNTEGIDDLYLRSDLRSAGEGSYQVLTEAFSPVTPLEPHSFKTLPDVAGTSTDLSRVLFESRYRLTPDAPANQSPKLYKSVDGTVSYVGILPASEGGGVAPRSIAGQGAGAAGGEQAYTPHVLSADGSRGFFTVPSRDEEYSGVIYMRDDHGTASTADDETTRINVSERTHSDTTQPATYWNAASDGSRVFFTTKQALTEDAPVGTTQKLYVYNTELPPSDPHNLTFISADNQPADPEGDVLGVLGANADGKTVYFTDQGQIVAGQPVLEDVLGIYVWQEGSGVRYVGQMTEDTLDLNEDQPGEAHFLSYPPWQLGTRITPDGRFLLLSLRQPPWPGGFNQEGCEDGCRELYLYDSTTGAHPKCISCGPTAPSTDAFLATRVGQGASGVTQHQNSPMLPDGSKVFFTTGEALVPQDENSTDDVYEYDTATETVHLISSGKRSSDSTFLDATPDGHDVYFATYDRLSAWDTDQSRDVYDARVGGGVPPPPPPASRCNSACQGEAPAPPADLTAVSSLLTGSSNLTAPPSPLLAPRPKPKPLRCRRPKVPRRVRGRVRCLTRAQVHRLQSHRNSRPSPHRSVHAHGQGGVR